MTVQDIAQQERHIWRTKTLERMSKATWNGSKIHSEPCKCIISEMLVNSCSPSGHPGHILHVILDCPTLESQSCTSLDHNVLDPKNQSMKALMGKGFSADNCFIFDSFPRRVKFGSTITKKNAREIWPEFKVCHDALHREYRRHGGQVTLLMGDNAEKAWKDILRSEHVDAQRLDHSEGFDVWGEISTMVSLLDEMRSDRI